MTGSGSSPQRPHMTNPYLDNPTLKLLVVRRPDLVISKLSLRHPDTDTGYTEHNADTSMTPMLRCVVNITIHY